MTREDLSLQGSFEAFLAGIEPAESSHALAASSHRVLRDRLSTDPRFGREHQETFLVGSYRRRTAIRPIKDVDIVVVLAADWRKESPERVLGRLRRVLDRYYPAKTADSGPIRSPVSVQSDQLFRSFRSPRR